MIHLCKCDELSINHARVINTLYFPKKDLGNGAQAIVISVMIAAVIPNPPEEIKGWLRLFEKPVDVLCYGRLADACALHLSPGRTVHLILAPIEDEVDINIEGMKLYDEHGVPYKKTKTIFILRTIAFGKELSSRVKQHDKDEFEYGMEEFGYAKVVYK